jgi:hypothetical protein
MISFYDRDCDADESEIAELKAEARLKRQHFNRLMAHPDPRDPEWPGHWTDDEKE